MLTRTNRPNTSLSAFVVPGCAILTPSAVHLSARVPCHLLHFCCLRLWGKNKSIVFIFFLSLPTLHQMDKHKGTCCVAQHNTHAALCGLCRRHPWTLSKFSQPVRSVLTSEVEKKKEKVKNHNKKWCILHPRGWVYGECGNTRMLSAALGLPFIFLFLPGENSKLTVGMLWMVGRCMSEPLAVFSMPYIECRCVMNVSICTSGMQTSVLRNLHCERTAAALLRTLLRPCFA